MSLLTLIDALLNFVAPAFVVALCLAVLARWMFRRDGAALGFWAQAAVGFAAGVAVLVAGFWYFGHDGKMATYAALVLACGSAQWLAMRGDRS